MRLPTAVNDSRLWSYSWTPTLAISLARRECKCLLGSRVWVPKWRSLSPRAGTNVPVIYTSDNATLKAHPELIIGDRPARLIVDSCGPDTSSARFTAHRRPSCCTSTKNTVMDLAKYGIPSKQNQPKHYLSVHDF